MSAASPERLYVKRPEKHTTGVYVDVTDDYVPVAEVKRLREDRRQLEDEGAWLRRRLTEAHRDNERLAVVAAQAATWLDGEQRQWVLDNAALSDSPPSDLTALPPNTSV